MSEKEEVVYTKPTSQLDLERRLKNDNEVGPTVPQLVNPGTPDEGENLYIGTDPIYQNHANKTEAPLQAEKGPEADAEELFLSSYDKPEVNLKRREQLEKGEDQTVLDKPITDKVTEQSSPLFAVDPGAGEGNAEENVGEDEEDGKPSTSPTASRSTGRPGTTPPVNPNQA